MKKTTRVFDAAGLPILFPLGAVMIAILLPLGTAAQESSGPVEAASVRFGVDEGARASVAAEVVAAILEGRGQDTDWSTLEDALGVPVEEASAADPLRQMREDALRLDRGQEAVTVAATVGSAFWRPTTREEMATAMILLLAALAALVGSVVLLGRGLSRRRSVRARRPQGGEPVGLFSRLSVALRGPGAGPILAHDAALLLARLGKGPEVEPVAPRRAARNGLGRPAPAPSTELVVHHQMTEESGSSFRPGRGFRLKASVAAVGRTWDGGAIALLLNAFRDRAAQLVDGMLVALWLRKTPESGAE